MRTESTGGEYSVGLELDVKAWSFDVDGSQSSNSQMQKVRK